MSEIKYYGLTINFRPFGKHQKVKRLHHYIFLTCDERDDFFRKLPKWKKRYPFEYSFFIGGDE